MHTLQLQQGEALRQTLAVLDDKTSIPMAVWRVCIETSRTDQGVSSWNASRRRRLPRLGGRPIRATLQSQQESCPCGSSRSPPADLTGSPITALAQLCYSSDAASCSSSLLSTSTPNWREYWPRRSSRRMPLAGSTRQNIHPLVLRLRTARPAPEGLSKILLPTCSDPSGKTVACTSLNRPGPVSVWPTFSNPSEISESRPM